MGKRLTGAFGCLAGGLSSTAEGWDTRLHPHTSTHTRLWGPWGQGGGGTALIPQQAGPQGAQCGSEPLRVAPAVPTQHQHALRLLPSHLREGRTSSLGTSLLFLQMGSGTICLKRAHVATHTHGHSLRCRRLPAINNHSIAQELVLRGGW